MYLITPLKNRDIEGLRLGDTVYVSGKVYTARDKAHARALKEGRFPGDLGGGIVFHSGPVAEKKKGGWKIVSIGPTTSSRMNAMEKEFIEKFKVKAVIGKGGMRKEAVEGAVYLALTGGCSASMAKHVKKVSRVEWLDLGIPEAVWCLEVEKLGPLTVAIDSRGNSIYEEVDERARQNLREALK